ncbi:hypothetical protein GALMADRAFT_208956 [Galerina marginata CBS 339.88]|uniref:Uncharacterized protein n=1 Tax=Galerina marginata (strain CBS 339.88) TaxID=685588 RepID=A0A067TL27_GALM3|nr:hypothetical protein GALMADRAFT_208956 [Galerina marginata CBS 339.88]
MPTSTRCVSVSGRYRRGCGGGRHAILVTLVYRRREHTLNHPNPYWYRDLSVTGASNVASFCLPPVPHLEAEQTAAPELTVLYLPPRCLRLRLARRFVPVTPPFPPSKHVTWNLEALDLCGEPSRALVAPSSNVGWSFASWREVHSLGPVGGININIETKSNHPSLSPRVLASKSLWSPRPFPYSLLLLLWPAINDDVGALDQSN